MRQKKDRRMYFNAWLLFTNEKKILSFNQQAYDWAEVAENERS
jgi:hypothetical protein